jgi:hypothetical protein
MRQSFLFRFHCERGCLDLEVPAEWLLTGRRWVNSISGLLFLSVGVARAEVQRKTRQLPSRVVLLGWWLQSEKRRSLCASVIAATQALAHRARSICVSLPCLQEWKLCAPERLSICSSAVSAASNRDSELFWRLLPQQPSVPHFGKTCRRSLPSNLPSALCPSIHVYRIAFSPTSNDQS